MTQIISRSAWGAKPAKPGGNAFAGVLGLAVHWEDGAPPADHAQCDDAVRKIQAFHMGPSRGWSDIAYNYVACNHDYLFQGRVGGCAANGTDYGNQHFEAVCWLGGPGHTPTDGAKRAIAFCRTHLGLGGKPVHPHSFFFPTACPGPDLTAWVKAGAHAPGKPPAPPALKHYQVDGVNADGSKDTRWPYGIEEVKAFFDRQQDGHKDDPDTEPDHVWIVTRKGKGAK